ncbi:helix-turn-helix domain-containing protein [Skermania sp. ID1734]|uniref:IclR family transcriptional regulator n=1 Tax=Skermania sp. ID1734 TaxID=2597516 RepID=UPI00117D297D|nr:helix-turn-helix domain-containing protein [Skermania sp. ID1734]TSD93913.1 helix-turn-helix domain-containing protein [Skermania sp. ID1734]
MTEPSSVQARRSPPTERVVQVLDYLVLRKDQRFGLSELARELDLSKPTCLGILNALVDGGYLGRHPVDKTYGLGPALIAAGRAAQEGHAVGAIARRHLAELSDRFDAVCAASAVVGERITVLDVTCPEGQDAANAMVGQVYPFAPPIGLMYVLWSTDDDFDAWLRREPTLPVRFDDQRLRRVVEYCRETGYLVESLTAVGRRLHAAMAGVVAHNLPRELRELLGEMVSNVGERVRISGEEPGDVNLIAAPVFSPDGRQAMVLTLHVGGAKTLAEIELRGKALRMVADAVTAEMGGREPRRLRR